MRALQDITNHTPNNQQNKQYKYVTPSLRKLEDSFGAYNFQHDRELLEISKDTLNSRIVNQSRQKIVQRQDNQNFLKFSFNMEFQNASKDKSGSASKYDKSGSASKLKQDQNIQAVEKKQFRQYLQQKRLEILNENQTGRFLPIGSIKKNQKSRLQVFSDTRPNLFQNQSQNIKAAKPSYKFQQKSSITNKLKNQLNQYFQLLFDSIDADDLKTLSKYNCSFAQVPEDLKFALGRIFTSIKYKNSSYNKQQFVELCLKEISEFQSCQLQNYIKTSINRNRIKQERVPTYIQEQPIIIKRQKTVQIQDIDQRLKTPFQQRIEEVTLFRQGSAIRLNLPQLQPFQKHSAKQIDEARYLSSKKDIGSQSKTSILCQRNGLQNKSVSKNYNQLIKSQLNGVQSNRFDRLKQSQFQADYPKKRQEKDFQTNSRQFQTSRISIKQSKEGLESLDQLYKRVQSYLQSKSSIRQTRGVSRPRQRSNFFSVSKNI